MQRSCWLEVQKVQEQQAAVQKVTPELLNTSTPKHLQSKF